MQRFQSQMRSQFPRHELYIEAFDEEIEVSISDEKPVPAPHHRKDYYGEVSQEFQSQMRSQFPRHVQPYRGAIPLDYVSISDEKPVPAPLQSDL